MTDKFYNLFYLKHSCCWFSAPKQKTTRSSGNLNVPQAPYSKPVCRSAILSKTQPFILLIYTYLTLITGIIGIKTVMSLPVFHRCFPLLHQKHKIHCSKWLNMIYQQMFARPFWSRDFCLHLHHSLWELVHLETNYSRPRLIFYLVHIQNYHMGNQIDSPP